MKHHYQTTLLFLLFTTAALAQSFKPVSHWRAGSSGQDGIWDIAIDTAGNQYICGYFTGTVDMDPGTGVYNLTMPAGQTQPDAYLLKLDASGNFLWAKHFGGTVDAARIARGVEVDQLGNVYVHGTFRSNIRAESASTLWSTNTTGSSYSPFLFKFSSSGVLDWSYGWYSSTTGLIWDLDIDNFGNIYICGPFLGTFDFNPLSGSGNVLNKTSAGNLDMYICKISSGGTIIDVKTGGSTSADYFGSIKILNNNIYLSGVFSGTVDLNLGSGSSNFTSVGSRDVFIMKTDTSLNYQWAKTFGGQGDDYSRKLEVFGSELFHFGMFSGNADLNPDASATTFMSSNGSLDCYVQKLDASGTLIWVKTFGGTGGETASGLSVDLSAGILLSGAFENTVDFNPDFSDDYYLTSAGGEDGFILRLDSSGSFLNAAKYGSNATNVLTEQVYAVNSQSFNWIAGGNFYNTIDINPNTLVAQNVNSAGQDDMVYMKLDACLNAIVLYTENACGSSYKLPSGSMVYASGYYLDVMLSSQGCDSTNGITLVLNPLPNATVTQTGATFTAQPGLTYQWLNCQSNQPIAGETNQSFTATTNGQYAVMVSNGTCTDTSVCIALTNIGVQEAQLPTINLYPNPTTGLLNIQSTQPWQSAEVSDLLGRVVLTQKTSTTELDLSKLPAGIYLVKVYFKEGVVVQRVVKRWEN